MQKEQANPLIVLTEFLNNNKSNGSAHKIKAMIIADFKGIYDIAQEINHGILELSKPIVSTQHSKCFIFTHNAIQVGNVTDFNSMTKLLMEHEPDVKFCRVIIGRKMSRYARQLCRTYHLNYITNDGAKWFYDSSS